HRRPLRTLNGWRKRSVRRLSVDTHSITKNFFQDWFVWLHLYLTQLECPTPQSPSRGPPSACRWKTLRRLSVNWRTQWRAWLRSSTALRRDDSHRHDCSKGGEIMSSQKLASSTSAPPDIEVLE